MKAIDLVSRPLLAGIFIVAGIDTFRNPGPRAKTAAPVLERMGEVAGTLPGVPSEPVDLVKANAVFQVVAGGMLALGVMPRLAALGLAGSLVPTTLGGHRFWEIEDPAARGQQVAHFLKNAAILGGLLHQALG